MRGWKALLGFFLVGTQQQLASAQLLWTSLGRYPGADDARVNGTIVFSNAFNELTPVGGVRMGGTIVGLEASATGGIHVHEGFTCSDAEEVGGHYYTDDIGFDPWETTTWASDENGVASLGVYVPFYTLSEAFPIAGRAVVVHNSDGDRVACGLLAVTSGEVIELGRYPGYSASGFNTSGTLVVEETDSGVSITGTVGGVDESSMGGLHVHSGWTCDDASGVGGHYWETGEDPWTDEWTSDENGAALVSLSQESFSLHDSLPVSGRAFVVHAANGSRTACGIVGSGKTAWTSLGLYPDAEDAGVNGTVVFTLANATVDEGGVIMGGTLVGLEAGATGGIHVHEGFTCSDAEEVGGHYYTDDIGFDPWETTTWASDENGVASLGVYVPFYTLSEAFPIAGRAVVVHNSDGDRVACGLLAVTSGEVIELGRYPGYSASGFNTSGTLVVEETDSGVSITGTVGGVDESSMGGLHVHSGWTCDDASGVGGHYWETGEDPWTDEWTSDDNGAALVSLSQEDFSLRDSLPVSGRAFVVHAANGSRMACGIIGSGKTAWTSLGLYPDAEDAGVNGTVVFTLADNATVDEGGVIMGGTLVGLEASTTGGIHVHEGFTCSDAEGVGGHYYTDDIGFDPWETTTWASDENGVASLGVYVPFYTLSEAFPIAGRAVVVHNSDGDRVACGLLAVTSGEVIELGRYPGYSASGFNTSGTLVVEETDSGVSITGTVGGVDESSMGGLHVHSGWTCDDASGVGGYYWETGEDPWTDEWTSDDNGAALVSLSQEGFSLHDSLPVSGRAFVVHAANGSRTACGIVSSQVSMSKAASVGTSADGDAPESDPVDEAGENSAVAQGGSCHRGWLGGVWSFLAGALVLMLW